MEQQIQAYLRHSASRHRETVTIGPFLATFTPTSPNPFLNYAIPAADATPTPAEIAALEEAFRQRERIPRLEYIPTLAPTVEGALLRAGFTVESRFPLMICSAEQLVEVPTPDGIEIVAPTSDEELYQMKLAQNEAYGEGPPSQEDVQRFRQFLADGGIAMLARDAATGEPAGGGICTVPFAGATELTSVGVCVPYRRRGIAAAITARLARAAFDAGVTLVFLMAAGENEARIYARLNFIRIGEVLAIAKA